MEAQLMMTMRELHHRVSDGIHVRLLWCERSGHLTVTVTDGRSGSAFSVDVRDGEKALDVFNHPYAYAACHGINTAALSGIDEPPITLAA